MFSSRAISSLFIEKPKVAETVPQSIGGTPLPALSRAGALIVSSTHRDTPVTSYKPSYFSVGYYMAFVPRISSIHLFT